MGLHIMQYRAEQIDGLLQLRRREAGGTLVMCTLMSNSWKDLPNDESATSALKVETLDR